MKLQLQVVLSPTQATERTEATRGGVSHTLTSSFSSRAYGSAYTSVGGAIKRVISFPATVVEDSFSQSCTVQSLRSLWALNEHLGKEQRSWSNASPRGRLSKDGKTFDLFRLLVL